MVFRSLLLVLWGMVSAFPSIADVPDWLTPYPHAELVEERTASVDDYLLALGTYKRLGGVWRPEESQRLRGALQRLTWLVPSGHTAEESHRHWLEALAPFTQRILFRCRGRRCGGSHNWANDVFGIRELYGIDDTQFYDALELERSGQRYVAALYSVQRGNRRVYTQIDLLALSLQQAHALKVTAEALVEQLRASGRVVLATFAGDGQELSSEQLQALAGALRKDTRLQLYLVGHAYGDGSLAELEQRGRQYAERTLNTLREQGVDTSRLQPVSVGPLAPGRLGKVDRLELIVRQGL